VRFTVVEDCLRDVGRVAIIPHIAALTEVVEGYAGECYCEGEDADSSDCGHGDGWRRW